MTDGWIVCRTRDKRGKDAARRLKTVVVAGAKIRKADVDQSGK